jgi:hypothetical protein
MPDGTDACRKPVSKQMSVCSPHDRYFKFACFSTVHRVCQGVASVLLAVPSRHLHHQRLLFPQSTTLQACQNRTHFNGTLVKFHAGLNNVRLQNTVHLLLQRRVVAVREIRGFQGVFVGFKKGGASWHWQALVAVRAPHLRPPTQCQEIQRVAFSSFLPRWIKLAQPSNVCSAVYDPYLRLHAWKSQSSRPSSTIRPTCPLPTPSHGPSGTSTTLRMCTSIS